MLMKYLYAKYLCRHIIDNHCKDLQTSNYAKESQLKATRSKRQRFKAFWKPIVKERSIATFLLTNLLTNCTTPRGLFLLEKAFLILSIQCWFRSWHCSWGDLLTWRLQLWRSVELSLLTHMGWNFLVEKPPHLNKVSFIEGDGWL